MYRYILILITEYLNISFSFYCRQCGGPLCRKISEMLLTMVVKRSKCCSASSVLSAIFTDTLVLCYPLPPIIHVHILVYLCPPMQIHTYHMSNKLAGRNQTLQGMSKQLCCNIRFSHTP